MTTSLSPLLQMHSSLAAPAGSHTFSHRSFPADARGLWGAAGGLRALLPQVCGGGGVKIKRACLPPQVGGGSKGPACWRACLLGAKGHPFRAACWVQKGLSLGLIAGCKRAWACLLKCLTAFLLMGCIAYCPKLSTYAYPTLFRHVLWNISTPSTPVRGFLFHLAPKTCPLILRTQSTLYPLSSHIQLHVPPHRPRPALSWYRVLRLPPARWLHR